MAKALLNAAGLKVRSVPSGRVRPFSSFSGASLSKVVEGDIIPRLLMAHRHDPWPGYRPKEPDVPAGDLRADEIERFAILPLERDAGELLDEIEQFLARGVSVERVFVELLGHSARRLGELWEEDRCDFVEVTMGLWRLQEVMRSLAMRSTNFLHTVEAPPTVLFASMPGDQHSFGALMIGEIFSRSGWESEVVFEPTTKDLLAVVARRAFDLVGLTVTNDCPSGVLADLVSAIRSVSRNPAIRIIVGGRAINGDRALAAAVGADGTARDADSALVLAEQMMVENRLALGQV